MTILAEPQIEDVDVRIVTQGGARTREYGMRLDGKKKAHFDIATKRDTFFEARKVLGRNHGKTPIFGMPPAFDSPLEAGP